MFKCKCGGKMVQDKIKTQTWDFYDVFLVLLRLSIGGGAMVLAGYGVFFFFFIHAVFGIGAWGIALAVSILVHRIDRPYLLVWFCRECGCFVPRGESVSAEKPGLHVFARDMGKMLGWMVRLKPKVNIPA